MIRTTARRQRLRFTVGMIEIAGVGLSLGIIWVQGLTTLAVIALVATTALSVANLFLFRHD
jgi:hypothetical protein